MWNRTGAWMVAASAGLAVGSAALAGPVEVIYCKKPGHPKATVPGTVDINGNPTPYEFRAIEGLSVAADGSAWLISARTQAALVNSENDVVMLRGAGASGTVLVATVAGTSPAVPVTFSEGRPAPFKAGSDDQDPGTWDWFEFWSAGGLPRFDTAGNAVFAFRASTTQTGSTGSPDGQRVVTWNRAANTVALAFKQGDLYTGLVENPASGGTGDEAVGNSVGSVHLLDNGQVGSHDTTVVNIYSLLRPVLTYNRAGYHQVSTRTPTPDILTTTVSAGAFGAPGERFYWTALESGEFHTTPDGQHHYIEGRILDATTADDGVLVVGTPADGTVVLREGSAIPGSSPAIVVGDIFQTTMLNNGDWYARGRDSSGTTAAAPDWFVKNGVVVARTGDPITTGSGEHWGDTFLSFSATGSGDWLLVGNTDGADPGANEVVVLNGTQVLMREGDPVDLDGNGQFDDDAFIGRGNNALAAFDANDRWFLTSGGVLYGVVQLRNGAGVDLNTSPAFGTPQAFIRMTLGQACYANCDNSTQAPVLNVADFGCFLTRYAAGEAYANCDGSTQPPVLNVADFGCFLTKYAAGCP
ncbi:MAG: hypothetical protein WD749_06660 [Phycisphaerales bacterium]